MKQTIRNKKPVNNHDSFQFRDIIIHYDIPGIMDVYYLTNNHKYNADVDARIKDMGNKRIKLEKSNYLVECSLGFEYAWHGLYQRPSNIESNEAEKDRRDNIRKAAII